MKPSASSKYDTVSRAFHWITALAVTVASIKQRFADVREPGEYA